MPFECCVCGFKDTTDESGLRKAQRRLPLVPRPDVLLLSFQTAYNWVCLFCEIKNQTMIDEIKKKNNNFTPEEVFDHVENGRVELAKLVMLQLASRRQLYVARTHIDPLTQNNLLHVVSRLGYWRLGRWILQHQLQPNERASFANRLNRANHTPLSIACTRDNRDDMVLLFCKAGGNPNYIVEDSTCLMRACCSGQDMWCAFLFAVLTVPPIKDVLDDVHT